MATNFDGTRSSFKPQSSTQLQGDVAMSLARWDPFGELQNLENEMNRLFRRHLSGAARQEGSLTASHFAPPVDVYEDGSKLSIKMDVPGIESKDLDIRVDGNLLVVSGERKFESEEKKENFQRVEREYGSFSRSFTLPASADTENINASFDNGTLRIDIAKRADSTARQIKIGEGSTKTRKAA
jgi:HSP20 family protein